MILILGAGLAGLAAAYHLSRLRPEQPCLVLERESEAGGLCRSRRFGGFTFDFTGHYLHLRDPGITAWVDELIGDELVPIERRARIHSHGARLEFPFQAHLHGLPPEIVANCLLDFIGVSRQERPGGDGRQPFDQWARRVFGEAIAEHFMIPYNAKLFGVEPGEITAEWVAWAVPRPGLEQVVRGALGLSNEGMGYNPRFRYPRGGGIGVLAERLAAEVASDLRLESSCKEVDLAAREVVLSSGERLGFDTLISTLPLPALLGRLRVAPGQPLPPAAGPGKLRASAVLDLELGVRREKIAEGAHWIYFPEPEYPFYRVGFPSNVCPAMAPEGHVSLSVEFSHPSGEPPPPEERLLESAMEGLFRAGVLSPSDSVVLAELALIDPGYVLYDRERTELAGDALEWLEGRGVFSIGRFGGWTYSYMERALIEGKRAAEKVLADSCAD